MTNFTEKQIRETISKETIEQKKDRLLKTQLIFEANLERVRAEQDSLGVRVIHKTKAGLVCVMCAGYYPLPTGSPLFFVQALSRGVTPCPFRLD